jgi:hypothetical protein
MGRLQQLSDRNEEMYDLAPSCGSSVNTHRTARYHISEDSCLKHAVTSGGRLYQNPGLRTTFHRPLLPIEGTEELRELALRACTCVLRETKQDVSVLVDNEVYRVAEIVESV